MCLGSRSPQKAVTFSLFLVFRQTSVKMASQMGGQIAPENRLFSHWSHFGCPWVHCLDFWLPWASFWHLFGCPGHHFGTLRPHQNDAQRRQNSIKMKTQTVLAGFIFLVICSCVRCIMQHSSHRSSTTREPKIQCNCILKAKSTLAAARWRGMRFSALDN